MVDILFAFSGALVGGLITAVGNHATLKASVRQNREDIEDLQEHRDSMRDNFVTRREFDRTLRTIRDDVHNIAESVGAIRDFLLSRTEAERSDLK